MTGERQLVQGGEDPHPIIGPRVARFEYERGFAEVGPAGERRHALIAELIGAEHHRQRIALERNAAEDIYLLEIE